MDFRRFALLSLSACAASISTVPAAGVAAPEQTLVSAYNSTGQRLFQIFSENPGNIVLSPYSIGIALSMAFVGADGETARMIGDTLHLNLKSTEIATANAKLIADLKAVSGQDSVLLNTANALIEVKPHIVDVHYRDLLERAFSAEAFPGDVNAINQWIARKTSDKIPHMLDSLSDDTGIVLANAAYFKAFWQYPFDKNATDDEPFHLTAARDAQVKMMRDEDHFALVKSSDFKAIRLPYRSVGQRLAMIVVIPNAIDGLAALIKELGPERADKLRADLAAADSSDVQLKLPRFHAAYRTSLTPALENNGMRLAFDQNNADFRGMTGRLPTDLRVAIGDVIHCAVIDVNEESSEAAAATVVEMTATAMAPQYRPPPEPFVVDRPFLFFIVDDGTGSVLLQGRISDPRG